jgi:hypothetical protein
LEALVFTPDGERVPSVEDRVLRLIIESADAPAQSFRSPEFRLVQRKASEAALDLRTRRHEAETERNAITLALRRDAVERAATVKRRRATDILSRVADPRIRRMKEREIENIDAQMRQRLRELDSRARAIVSVSLVMEGQLTTFPPAV